MATFSDDDDLDKVWPQFVAKLAGTARWDLKTQTSLTPEQIVAKINPPKDRDAKVSQDTAKKVFERGLYCLKTFGQIAAQGASVV